MAPKEALAKYVSTTYLTSAKLMGAFGFSAAIAAPVSVFGLNAVMGIVDESLILNGAIGASWACGLISGRLLWTLYAGEKKSQQERYMQGVMAMRCLGAFSSPLIWSVAITVPSIIPTAVVLTAGCFTAAQTMCGPSVMCHMGYCMVQICI